MSLKKALSRHLQEKIDANHQAMDSGLPYDKYQQAAGANQTLADVLTWLSEFEDPDDASDELEELKT